MVAALSCSARAPAVKRHPWRHEQSPMVQCPTCLPAAAATSSHLERKRSTTRLAALSSTLNPCLRRGKCTSCSLKAAKCCECRTGALALRAADLPCQPTFTPSPRCACLAQVCVTSRSPPVIRGEGEPGQPAGCRVPGRHGAVRAAQALNFRKHARHAAAVPASPPCAASRFGQCSTATDLEGRMPPCVALA